MTYQIRRSNERKYFDHGWLKTYHTFSFGDYYDPKFMGFRDLRVINEDRVAPRHGFPNHGHKDMEIISICLEGALAHKDSMGTESIIRPNDIQAMSAGSGVIHSEYNPSEDTSVHFLQIWIVPDTKGIAPRYQQTTLPAPHSNEWQLIASKDGDQNSLKIQQEIMLYGLCLDAGKKENLQVLPSRYGWLQVIEGNLRLNEETLLQNGDGVAIDPGTAIQLEAKSAARLLFFDLK